MGPIRCCPCGDRRLQRDAWSSAPLVHRESMQKGSGRSAVVSSAAQGACHLRGSLLSRGSIRLFLSKPMEPQSPTHACVMSDVSREDDVRSLARSHLSPSRSDERNGVRLTRSHRGIRVVVFSGAQIESRPQNGLRQNQQTVRMPSLRFGGQPKRLIPTQAVLRMKRRQVIFPVRVIEPASGELFRRSCRIRGRSRSRKSLCSCRCASGPAMRSDRGKPAGPL